MFPPARLCAHGLCGLTLGCLRRGVVAVLSAAVLVCVLLSSPGVGGANAAVSAGVIGSAGTRATSAGSTIVRVFLAPRGGLRALEARVVAVSSPGSRRYRHFLTPAQFRLRYEPTRAQVRKVEHILRARGLKVVSVERYRRWVIASGSVRMAAARLGSAFASDAVGVTVVAAGARALRSAKPLPPIDLKTSAGLQVTRPCSQYFGQRVARFEADGRTPLPAFRGTRPFYAVCGYGPRQLRDAYEGRTSLTGRGVTVAIVLPFTDATVRSDANTWAVRHGERPFTARQFSERLPGSFDLSAPVLCGSTQSWEVEQSLDVEAVHAMAPGADIRYYAAPRCDDPSDPGPIAALDAVVDENRASIVTNSYADPEVTFPSGVRAGFEQAFLQAAMQGITVLFSSGDFGSLVEYPSSDPWVTSVGGTSTAIGSRNNLLFQTGWESDAYQLSADASAWTPAGALNGGGGGFSTLFARPVWQHGLIPPGSPSGRAVPDVSMDANPLTGMDVGQTQRFPDGVRYGEVRLGGTSLASPLFAGIEALAVQSTRGRLGWIDPALYEQARRGASTFIDITAAHDDLALVRPQAVDAFNPAAGIKYGLRTLSDSVGFGLQLTPSAGWDPATGLGTPNRRYFLSQGR
jgi:subtilase family serine protease